MRTHFVKIAAAAALGLAVSGGSAYAAEAPSPQPTAAQRAPVHTPGLAASAGVTPQAITRADGVAIRSYTRFLDRGFGFVFSGLQPTDTVRVTWRKVIDKGAVSTNFLRGTGAQEGMGWWYSGRQPGWLTATARVIRDGKVVVSQRLDNARAVAITSRRTGSGFSFFVANAHPRDRMLVQWTTRDGQLHTYMGPAEDFTMRRITRWTTATVKVYVGTKGDFIVAPPLTISSPSA